MTTTDSSQFRVSLLIINSSYTDSDKIFKALRSLSFEIKEYFTEILVRMTYMLVYNNWMKTRPWNIRVVALWRVRIITLLV